MSNPDSNFHSSIASFASGRSNHQNLFTPRLHLHDWIDIKLTQRRRLCAAPCFHVTGRRQCSESRGGFFARTPRSMARSVDRQRSGTGDDLLIDNCIKHFHWTIRLFWPIRFDVTIVSIGNNCSVKPNWPESPFGTVVKSNLIDQNHTVNWGNPLYNWVLMANITIPLSHMLYLDNFLFNSKVFCFFPQTN